MVAVALLVTSALVVQSFVRLAYQPLGFKANGVRVLNNEMGRVDADAQIAVYGPFDGVNVSGVGVTPGYSSWGMNTSG